MKFLTNLDLSQNEIQNAVIQPLAAAPANPKLGQIYYNSSDSLLYQYDGAQWKPVGKGYELPAATKTALGGIKVGDRLTVAADGTLSADKQTDNNLTVALKANYDTAYRGDRGKVAYEHSQAQHAPADAEKNVQADWNVEDTNSDAYIQNKPTIPKAVTKTVQTMTAATTATYTVSGYIVSVVLIDSVTKEQIMGDLSFDNATASANSKVTVTFSAAPTNPVLVIITSVAL